jgi:hypothetical protein
MQIRFDRVCNEPGGDFRNENENHELGTGFLYMKESSAVKRV